eukprot:scaffold201364_cov15-Tisochrysis_lutea.AAC.1
MLCDTIPWVSRRCNEAGRVGERSRLGVGSGGEGMLAPVLAWPWREDVRGRGRGCKGPGEPNGIVLEVPTAEVEAGWFAGVGTVGGGTPFTAPKEGSVGGSIAGPPPKVQAGAFGAGWAGPVPKVKAGEGAGGAGAPPKAKAVGP